MIIIAKYSGFATEDNLAGTDLDFPVVSDTLGGTTLEPVSEGDVVANIEIVDGNIFVVLFEVHDGSPWTEGTQLSTGDLLITVGTGVAYQQGLAGVILDNGTIGTLNLQVTLGLLP
jgi:hypothetical protein